MTTLPDRLREASKYALMDAAREIVLDAADEIERLQCLARFCERALRNGVTAAISDEEREAIHWAVGDVADITGPVEETLRGLLERLK